MADSKRSTIVPSIYYRDPWAGLEWLERAFGFERRMVITEPDGSLTHAELGVGDGLIMLGGEWSDHVASPASVGRKNTQGMHIHLEDGIDAHCERARAAGAEILAEPEDQFYGDRTYRAGDPEGHVWTFAETVRAVTREEAERASGLTIEGWV